METASPDTSGFTHLSSGKVRDIYAVDDEHLLLVASDRISAYDFILETPIPDKGRILTALSAWWFEQLADLVGHHVVDHNPTGLPLEWQGRSMLVKRLTMLPIECVARGYLAGSAVPEVRATGSLGGLRVPVDTPEGAKLSEPVYTPATKAEVGAHDENISYDQTVSMVGAEVASELRRLTLAIYRRAAAVTGERGILLADFKLEFGLPDDSATASELVLADEVLTPDSSRFWPADRWQPGHPQPSFDKQYVRDWLTSPASGWDRTSDSPPPPLPEEVVAQTRQRYLEAYHRLTGERFE